MGSGLLERLEKETRCAFGLNMWGRGQHFGEILVTSERLCVGGRFEVNFQ